MDFCVSFYVQHTRRRATAWLVNKLNIVLCFEVERQKTEFIRQNSEGSPIHASAESARRRRGVPVYVFLPQAL